MYERDNSWTLREFQLLYTLHLFFQVQARNLVCSPFGGQNALFSRFTAQKIVYFPLLQPSQEMSCLQELSLQFKSALPFKRMLSIRCLSSEKRNRDVYEEIHREHLPSFAGCNYIPYSMFRTLGSWTCPALKSCRELHNRGYTGLNIPYLLSKCTQNCCDAGLGTLSAGSMLPLVTGTRYVPLLLTHTVSSRTSLAAKFDLEGDMNTKAVCLCNSCRIVDLVFLQGVLYTT
ncbi:hypothetical protein ABKN59_011600 [Abortiporus biennis]